MQKSGASRSTIQSLESFYTEEKDTLNTFVEKKKYDHRAKSINELDFSNPKATWRKINHMFNRSGKKTSPLPLDVFYNFFKSQRQAKTDPSYSNRSGIGKTQNPIHDCTSGPLDYEIEATELTAAFKRVKKGKTPGYHNILNEIILLSKTNFR